MTTARVTLEMWRAFIAIAEQGSAAKAALLLHKSQSAVCHSIKKMESLLGQPLFVVEGRQSVLTELGQALLPRAQSLHHNAVQIESVASKFQGQLMTEVSLAVDVLLPHTLTQSVFERFYALYPNVSLRIYETALSGAGQLLASGVVSLAIASQLPKETVAEPLLDLELRCVCAPDFAFAQAQQMTQSELKAHRQVVIRDSGQQNTDSGWLGSHQRLTVSSLDAAVAAVRRGLGFGWLPQHAVAEPCRRGELVLVDLSHGQNRRVSLKLGMNPELAHIGEISTLFELFHSLSMATDAVASLEAE
ncbi:LysR family transcriptional regulator [Photobacterium sp. 1_MG-2023]|uniref:LysR family transcriptional regulator n=1 Tax=Photobacterium sp. 1_MG-2023 TaxID=3062646 RepID=UPI0026E19D9D|nr:LysR family transcriptional regulator [Photobacterium sp. 1_MG-2023]MDO6707892.1 LysR family transcriptional regulator [Photobacterium sp. 1_MG-2023]